MPRWLSSTMIFLGFLALILLALLPRTLSVNVEVNARGESTINADRVQPEGDDAAIGAPGPEGPSA